MARTSRFVKTVFYGSVLFFHPVAKQSLSRSKLELDFCEWDAAKHLLKRTDTVSDGARRVASFTCRSGALLLAFMIRTKTGASLCGKSVR